MTMFYIGVFDDFLIFFDSSIVSEPSKKNAIDIKENNLHTKSK